MLSYILRPIHPGSQKNSRATIYLLKGENRATRRPSNAKEEKSGRREEEMYRDEGGVEQTKARHKFVLKRSLRRVSRQK